jgi:hypothetical protein
MKIVAQALPCELCTFLFVEILLRYCFFYFFTILFEFKSCVFLFDSLIIYSMSLMLDVSFPLQGSGHRHSLSFKW